MFECLNDIELPLFMQLSDSMMRAQVAFDKNCMGIIAIALVMITAIVFNNNNAWVMLGIGAICSVVGVKFGQVYEKAKASV